MSSNKKLITTYAKALFQSVQVFETLEMKDTFKVVDVTDATNKKGYRPDAVGSSDTTVSENNSTNDDNTFEPNVYIIGEELLLLSATIQSSKSLKDFFKNPTYLEAQKLDILLSIFPGLTVITCSFLKVLTERSHLSLIPEITKEYTRLILKAQKSTKVKLILANMLQESYGALLLNTLRKITDSKEIILNVSYSSQLLGGLIIEYKSTSIDASLLKEFGLFFSDI